MRFFNYLVNLSTLLLNASLSLFLLLLSTAMPIDLAYIGSTLAALSSSSENPLPSLTLWLYLRVIQRTTGLRLFRGLGASFSALSCLFCLLLVFLASSSYFSSSFSLVDLITRLLIRFIFIFLLLLLCLLRLRRARRDSNTTSRTVLLHPGSNNRCYFCGK